LELRDGSQGRCTRRTPPSATLSWNPGFVMSRCLKRHHTVSEPEVFRGGGGRNRTHRTGIARPTRVEDEGGHQTPFTSDVIFADGIHTGPHTGLLFGLADTRCRPGRTERARRGLAVPPVQCREPARRGGHREEAVAAPGARCARCRRCPQGTRRVANATTSRISRTTPGNPASFRVSRRGTRRSAGRRTRARRRYARTAPTRCARSARRAHAR
jgi:hypothetical protein